MAEPSSSILTDARADEAWSSRLQRNVEKYLQGEIDVGSFPGAVYAVGDASGILVQNALGHSVLVPAKIPVSVDTLYDVASLTKPLITSTLVLRTAAEGKIELGDAVSSHLRELDVEGKRELTFIDLLSHRGGFQAWYPLYTQGTGDAAYLAALVKRPLRYRPGTREIYTCLGFILLHLTLERIWGRSVEDLALEKIFNPLGLEQARFNPPPQMKYSIAATEWGNSNERQMVAARNLTFQEFRNYMIWGEVDDGNAYYMGGMAGNAGLFATAADVYAIARSYLDRKETVLPDALVQLSLRDYTLGFEENRGLGWQLQAERPEHPSAVLSEHCFGHTGFTGTSVWVDPERNLIMVLLTNRLHPSFKPFNMQKVRRRFHAIVVEEWDRRTNER